jgi:hypothetical protein
MKKVCKNSGLVTVFYLNNLKEVKPIRFNRSMQGVSYPSGVTVLVNKTSQTLESTVKSSRYICPLNARNAENTSEIVIKFGNRFVKADIEAIDKVSKSLLSELASN